MRKKKKKKRIFQDNFDNGVHAKEIVMLLEFIF